MIIRWIRSHPVAAVVTIIVFLFLVFLTEKGYESEYCPLCGQVSSGEGIRVIGIPLTVSTDVPSPCLLPDHRFFHLSSTWRLWWSGGGVHSDGYAGFWSRNYRLTLGPWIRNRPPADPGRRRILATIQQASLEQLDELLTDDSFMLWEDIGELLNPPGRKLADRWGDEILQPWTERVQTALKAR
jgi:hypothetical protein